MYSVCARSTEFVDLVTAVTMTITMFCTKKERIVVRCGRVKKNVGDERQKPCCRYGDLAK